MAASQKRDWGNSQGLVKQMGTGNWTLLQRVRYTVLLSLIGVITSISFQTIQREFQTAFQDKEQNKGLKT